MARPSTTGVGVLFYFRRDVLFNLVEYYTSWTGKIRKLSGNGVGKGPLRFEDEVRIGFSLVGFRLSIVILCNLT